jgi:hypothetical protein
MRKVHLKPMNCSTKPGMDGDDGKVEFSGEPEQKVTVDLRLQDPSPFDSFYREAP